MPSVGFVRAGSGIAVSSEVALVELAKEAREILLQVAAAYRSTITYQQLAAEVQRKARIRAGDTPRWLEDTIDMVAHVCHRLAEPPLTSLIVDAADGHVGDAYDEVLRTAGLPLAADPDARELAAAASRLECYRRFAPAVPENAQPTLVTPDAAKRTPSLRPTGSDRASGRGGSGKPVRAARPAVAPRARRDPDANPAPFVLCSSCFIQTPPGDECQNCGAPLK